MNLTDDKRKDWEDIQSRTERLIATYNERDTVLEDMRQMLHMEWKDDPSRGQTHYKSTMSPMGYDSLVGAARLLTSTEPKFNVPHDEANAELRAIAEPVEKAAASMWSGSGRVLGRPVHYEMVLSSLMSAEIVGTISRTADLVDATAGMSKGRYQRQARQAQRETPYLFQIHNAAHCYTEYTMLGPSAVVRKSETTWGDALAVYGRAAEDADLKADRPTDERVTLYDWTCYDYRAVWMSGCSDPIIFEEHGLDFLPVVSVVTDGSFLWSEPHRQRLPFLYGLLKSKIWQRQNLMLTVIYSMIYGLGSNPQLVRETKNPGESPLIIDRTIPGGVVDIEQGEKLYPLIEKIIDPAQMQGMSLADQIAEGTTIPRVALGAAPSGSMAFSTISLLTQSGRLPLMGTKQNAAHAAAEMVRRALLWMRAGGAAEDLYDARGSKIGLDPHDIPDRLPLECVLEVDLPSDKLQLVNAANGAVGQGLTSRRWARENVLGEGQSDAMEKEIMQERMTQTLFEQYVQGLTAKQQMALQQMQQAQQAAAAQSMANGIPEARTGQLAEISSSQGVYPPGGVQPGSPLAGPLPPRGMPQ